MNGRFSGCRLPFASVPYPRSGRSLYASSHAGGPLLPACRHEPRPSSRGRSHRNRPSNFRVSCVPSSLFSLLRLREPQRSAAIGFDSPVSFRTSQPPPATTHPRHPLQRGECRPRPTPSGFPPARERRRRRSTPLFSLSSLLAPHSFPSPLHPNPRRSPLGDQVTQRPHQSIHPVWRR